MPLKRVGPGGWAKTPVTAVDTKTAAIHADHHKVLFFYIISSFETDASVAEASRAARDAGASSEDQVPEKCGSGTIAFQTRGLPSAL